MLQGVEVVAFQPFEDPVVEGLVDPAGVVHARKVREAAGRVDGDPLRPVALDWPSRLADIGQA